MSSIKSAAGATRLIVSAGAVKDAPDDMDDVRPDNSRPILDGFRVAAVEHVSESPLGGSGDKAKLSVNRDDNVVGIEFAHPYQQRSARSDLAICRVCLSKSG